jgi:energy-coupling factor transporter ATP-binding protein EcfA2
MFLRHLTLENIRSIESIDIDFTPPEGSVDPVRRWTCILGENGIGKSTILRAIGLLMAGSDTLPKLIDDPTRWLRLKAKTGRISAQIATQDGEVRDISLNFKVKDTLTSFLKRNEATLKPVDAALRHTLRSYFTAGYGVSRRFPSPDSDKFQSATSVPPRAASIATLFRGDSSLRSIESWAMDLHYRKGTAGLIMIRQALNALLPEVKFYGIDKEKRQLLFKTSDGRIPLAELSDGYQSIISWYGDLLFRITESFQDYKKPQDARGLLLLDEIDLHLHPKWQRRVIDHIRTTLPHFQFIATTHSPLTAQQCGEAELYVLKREEAKKHSVRLHHYEGSPDLLRIDQLLVSPIFGLDTGMSLRVQELREKPAAQRTAGEKETLRSVPRPRVDQETEDEKVALLRELIAARRSRKTSTRSIIAFAPPSAGRASRRPAAYIPPPVRPTDRSLISTALKAK